jgi:hypothetical protein
VHRNLKPETIFFDEEKKLPVGELSWWRMTFSDTFEKLRGSN